jgi:RecA-family ATPase
MTSTFLPDASRLWGAASLQSGAPRATPWLWEGYLAPGALTLLTSLWKSGKTTLVSVLLAKLKAGGRLAGLSLAPAKAVVISEEPPALWELRSRQLDFGDHVGWFCRPLPGKPSPTDWLALIERVGQLHTERDVRLVVIDPLAAFLPGRSENDAATMLEALMPLQRLTSQGMSVLVLHHPRKQESAPGRAPRASGALLGHADILIEMRACPKASDDDRRRRLHASSRYDETPREHVIELTADGADYVYLGRFEDAEFSAHWKVLQPILAAASRKLSRSEIYRLWPANQRVDPMSLSRWLNRAVESGLASRDGRGRSHPFRYWLTAQEYRWPTTSPSPLRGEG